VEWYQHELQCHAKQWVCYVSSCGAISNSPQDLRSHFTKEHSQQPDELVINQCERATTSLRDQCPFCPLGSNPVPVDHLKDHVGHHLIDIALFTLPWVDLDTDDDSSKSGKAEQCGNSSRCEGQNPRALSNASFSVPGSESNAFGPSSAYGDSTVGEAAKFPPNEERAEGSLPAGGILESPTSPNMESLGLAIGVVDLTRQLAKAAIDCYKIFNDMSDVGSTYDAILHELRTQGLLLKGWEQAWGFGSGSNHQPQLDPGDYRYRYVTAILARIVAIFASVNELPAKYGVVIKKESAVVEAGQKSRFRDRLAASIPARLRPKSPGPATNTAQISISGATKDDLHLLENPQILESQHILPGLDDEITAMTQAIDRVQQSLPIYPNFKWVISDNAKLEELLKKLTHLNNKLFQLLPTAGSTLALQIPPTSPQDSQLKLSFDIPFLPNINIPKYSGFVGREYLLKALKQEVEEGNHTLNTIVLYGTGGMGKTQLALEYIHQNYKEHSSVFWINAASDQTTILGFTQIMQRLIRHHAEFSEDYSHVGQLLGMAGKLDSNGSFAVAQPSDAQYIVDAVKRWFALPKNTNWLLAFDNLDDPDLVDLGEYIPACNHGTVIITSRRRDLQQSRRGFEVQQMQPVEAIQLLLTACAIPKFEDLVPSGE